MRAKFGDCIYACTVCAHCANSSIILITTSNGVYSILMKNNEEAEVAYRSMLANGYYDFSNYEYYN